MSAPQKPSTWTAFSRSWNGSMRASAGCSNFDAQSADALYSANPALSPCEKKLAAQSVVTLKVLQEEIKRASQ
jgi:hypothetical protein